MDTLARMEQARVLGGGERAEADPTRDAAARIPGLELGDDLGATLPADARATLDESLSGPWWRRCKFR